MDETKADKPKKTAEPAATAGEIEALRAENAALHQRQDQMLDFMAELQTKLDHVSAVQAGTPAATGKSPIEDELEREHAALMAEFADLPNIDVLERRAVLGTDANTDIRLKDEHPIEFDPAGKDRRWKLRWFNFGRDGRADEASAKGYVKVRWDELHNREAIAAGIVKDEYVRKGERGNEVLCKIPLKYYTYIKKREAAAAQGLLSSETALRDRLANGAASIAAKRGENADQAGSFVSSREFVASVKPQTPERVSL